MSTWEWLSFTAFMGQWTSGPYNPYKHNLWKNIVQQWPNVPLCRHGNSSSCSSLFCPFTLAFRGELLLCDGPWFALLLKLAFHQGQISLVLLTARHQVVKPVRNTIHSLQAHHMGVSNHWQLNSWFNRFFNKENIKVLQYWPLVRGMYFPHKEPLNQKYCFGITSAQNPRDFSTFLDLCVEKLPTTETASMTLCVWQEAWTLWDGLLFPIVFHVLCLSNYFTWVKLFWQHTFYDNIIWNKHLPSNL